MLNGISDDCQSWLLVWQGEKLSMNKLCSPGKGCDQASEASPSPSYTTGDESNPYGIELNTQ